MANTTEDVKNLILEYQDYLAVNDFRGFYNKIVVKTTEHEKHMLFKFLEECDINLTEAIGDSMPKLFGYIPEGWKSVDSHRFVPQTWVTIPPTVKRLEHACFLCVSDVDYVDARDVEQIDSDTFTLCDASVLMVGSALQKIHKYAFKNSEIVKVQVDGNLSDDVMIELATACGNESIDIEVI